MRCSARSVLLYIVIAEMQLLRFMHHERGDLRYPCTQIRCALFFLVLSFFIIQCKIIPLRFQPDARVYNVLKAEYTCLLNGKLERFFSPCVKAAKIIIKILYMYISLSVCWNISIVYTLVYTLYSYGEFAFWGYEAALVHGPAWIHQIGIYVYLMASSPRVENIDLIRLGTRFVQLSRWTFRFVLQRNCTQLSKANRYSNF